MVSGPKSISDSWNCVHIFVSYQNRNQTLFFTMSLQSSVLTQSATGVVPSGPQRLKSRAYLPTMGLSSTGPPTQYSGTQEEPPSRPVSEVSLYCDAAQSQHSSDAETQPPLPSSTPTATARSSTAPEDVWNYSEPIPGSKAKKLIFYKAPFKWGQWPEEEWHERFLFVKDQLVALVYKHLRLVDFTNRPTYSARMVGASPSEARPAVVVTCRDADFKNIRKLFNSKAAEALCLGKVPAMSQQLRASFSRRTERNGPDIPRLQLVYYRAAIPVKRLALAKPMAVSLGAGNAACGATIQYGERSATLGVALDIFGEPKILTVDHLFSFEKNRSQPSTSGRRCSYHPDPACLSGLGDLERIDSNSLWNDDDEYEDLNLPNFESSGLHGDRINSDSLWDDDDDSEDLTWDDDETWDTYPLDFSTADAGLGAEALEGGSAQWKWSLFAKSPRPASSDVAYLDWALIESESTTLDPSAISLNTVFPAGNEKDCIVLKEILHAPAHNLAPVYVVSGIRGILSGEILGAPTFLPATIHHAAGQSSSLAWTVILKEPSGKC